MSTLGLEAGKHPKVLPVSLGGGYVNVFLLPSFCSPHLRPG